MQCGDDVHTVSHTESCWESSLGFLSSLSIKHHRKHWGPPHSQQYGRAGPYTCLAGRGHSCSTVVETEQQGASQDSHFLRVLRNSSTHWCHGDHVRRSLVHSHPAIMGSTPPNAGRSDRELTPSGVSGGQAGNQAHILTRR